MNQLSIQTNKNFCIFHFWNQKDRFLSKKNYVDSEMTLTFDRKIKMNVTIGRPSLIPTTFV